MRTNIFYNPSENRLRAGWRILLYLIIQIGLSILLSNLVKLLLGGFPEDRTWYIAVRAILVLIIVPIAVGISRKFFDKKSVVSLGLRFNRLTVWDLLIGFFLSGLMVGIIFITLMAAGMLEIQSIHWSGTSMPAVLGILVWFIGIGVVVGLTEEMAFRGYLLQNLQEGIGMTWAIIISCILYGVVHMSNPNSSLLSGTLIAVIGFLRIFGWLRTGQLWLSMGMHAGWNFFQGPIFGFKVSGLKIESLIQHSLSGPKWITGGVFGPEAGIVVLPVIALGLLVMYFWTVKRENIPWIKWNSWESL
jgi:hypothetical protein